MSKNSYSKVGGENVRLLQALIDEAPSYTKPTNSRNANILKSIINNTEYNEPPQSEIEELLIALKAKIGGEIEVNELTVTENGSYDAGLNKAYNPVNVELPLDSKEITANGTYNASDDNLAGFSQVTVNVEGYKLKDIENTPTAIATFSDGANLLMPKLEVAIEPQQDLHGYDNPWVGGAGKNKLQNVRSTTTINGITFTVNNDGSVFIAGGQTASEFTVFNLIANNLNYYNLTDFGLSYDTDYIINGCPSGGSSNTYRLVFRSGGSAGNKVDAGSGVSFNIASDGNTLKWMPCIMVDANYTIPSGGLLFKPMIRLSTVSDSTFAPYSNICPIIGWDEVNVGVSGVNVWDEEWEYSAQRFKNKNKIRILPNTQYYFKAPVNAESVFFYDKNKNQIAVRYQINGAFTTPSDANYMSFDMVSSYGTTYNNDISINYPSTDTSYHAYNGQTYTIDLDGTRYGGTLDVVSGTMTVDRASIKLNDLNWTKQNTSSNNWRFTTSQPIQNIKLPTNVSSKIDNLCSVYQNVTANETWTADKTGIAINTDGTLIICDLNQADTTALGAVIANQTYCYELATPITIQLNPTLVKSLQGINNVFADSGDILDGKYFAEL